MSAGPRNANPFSQDKEIDCADCGLPFIWSAGDQGFYADKNFSPPKRCPDCRAEAKERRARGLEEQRQR